MDERKVVAPLQVDAAIVACMAVLYILIMGILLFVSGRTPSMYYQYNLVPFETIRPLLMERERYNTDTWVKNLFGNIVLFIPLGIWIPMVVSEVQTIHDIYIYSCFASAGC